MSTAANPAVPKRKRRWYQFSLRTLFVFVTLCALPLGWVAFMRGKAQRQKALVENLTRIPPETAKDRRTNSPTLERLFKETNRGWHEPSRVGYDVDNILPPIELIQYDSLPRRWLRPLLGDDSFRDVEWLDVDVQPDTRLNELDILSKLTKLALYGELTDAKLAELPELKSVEHLELTSDACTGVGLANLRKFPNLISLELCCEKCSGVDLAQLKELKKLRMFKTLSMAMTDKELGYLRNLTQLECLEAIGPDITDNGLQYLKRLTNLKSLTLYCTKFTHDGAVYLTFLTQLENLTLVETEINDAVLQSLEKMSNLKRLSATGVGGIADAEDRLRRALPNCEISIGYHDP